MSLMLEECVTLHDASVILVREISVITLQSSSVYCQILCHKFNMLQYTFIPSSVWLWHCVRTWLYTQVATYPQAHGLKICF